MGRVGIKDQIWISPGLSHNEGPKLRIGPGSMFRARDWIGIKILGIDPSLLTWIGIRLMVLYGTEILGSIELSPT